MFPDPVHELQPFCFQWEEKRVFYMTPQTLMNDLAGGRCDPSKIILLVIGECFLSVGLSYLDSSRKHR